MSQRPTLQEELDGERSTNAMLAARCSDLQARVDALTQERDRATAHSLTLSSRFNESQREAEALRTALRKHGRHDLLCITNLSYPPKPCDCGLDAALSGEQPDTPETETKS